MSTPEKQAALRRFYNALRDEPLEPGSEYYVPYLSENPEEDYIAFLETEIAFSDIAGVTLLSGQRGTGKSTELRRLKQMLEKQGCVVFLRDLREYMNMTSPVEITDFFVSMMGSLSEAVTDRYGEDLLKESFWQKTVRFLNTEVKIDELGFEVAGASLKASLKDDTSFRQTLQQRMRGHVARLIKQAQDFAVEVVESVRKREGDPAKKVVFLLDSVEQIRGVGVDEAQAVYKSVENLFSGHADSLRIPLLHVVYTIPPWLPALSQNLGSYLGTVHTLPSIHIYQNRSREPDEKGLEVLRRLIMKRCPEWEQVFTPAQMDRIALNTGGDLREFFYLIKQSLTRASAARSEWPIPDRIIEGCENSMRREMMPIAQDDAAWLRRIADTHDPQLESVQRLPDLARFFDTKLVLNYRNGDDWYDLHPLIRDSLD